MQDILSWMDQRKTTLIKRDFQRHFRWLVFNILTVVDYFLFSSFVDHLLTILFLSCDYQLSWTGDKASKELQEANISLQNFPILQQCAKKVLIIIKISVMNLLMLFAIFC